MGSKGLPKGITQRPDGRYMARFQYKGEKYCLYDHDIEKVQERMSDLKYEVRHGAYTKERNITVNAWFRIWIDEYKRNSVKETTIFRYISAYKKHIEKIYGEKRLKDIRPEHIQKLYNNLKGTETVAIVSTILSGMFKQAYNNQIINKNPISLTTIPKARTEKTERRVLTLYEQELLMKYSSGTLRKLIEVSLSTGLRTGELRALEWKDIDFENKIIHVTGTLTEVTGKLFKDTPKTKSSKRDIPMLENVERIFIEIKDEEKRKKLIKNDENKMGDDFEDIVFKSRRGTPVSNSSYSRMLNRTVDKINSFGIEFEHVHPHTLRHTFATRCIENGMPPQVLKTILGHSSLSMTMDLYAHVLPNTKAEEMQKIAGLF